MSSALRRPRRRATLCAWRCRPAWSWPGAAPTLRSPRPGTTTRRPPRPWRDRTTSTPASTWPSRTAGRRSPSPTPAGAPTTSAPHRRAADPAVLRLHPVSRRVPDDHGRHRGRAARTGREGGEAGAGRLRHDRSRPRHPRRPRRVPGPVRRRPAGPVRRAHRQPEADRPGAAVGGRAAGGGRRPAALVAAAPVRSRRRGARGVRRRQHRPRHRRRPRSGGRGA